MSDDTVEALIGATRGVVTAAAGCGKTEAIALAVGTLGATRRQLVLTHTHAGVAALKRRMAQLNVPPSHYRIETIAGWCLRLAAHYPQLGSLYIFEYFLRTSELQETLGLVRAASPRADCEGISQD